jgi:hypothetical protein
MKMNLLSGNDSAMMAWLGSEGTLLTRVLLYASLALCKCISSFQVHDPSQITRKILTAFERESQGN